MTLSVRLGSVRVRFSSNGAELKVSPVGAPVEGSQGQFIALAGPNGVGKSVFLKVVSGVWPDLDPKTARILDNETVFELDGVHVPPFPGVHDPGRRVVRCAYLGQAPRGNICCRSVGLELRLALEHSALTREEVRAAYDEGLARVESLGITADQNPHSLSKSQQQLVALESLLAAGPHVLVLDEPTTALDGEHLTMFVGRVSDSLLCGRIQLALAATHDVRLLERGEVEDVYLESFLDSPRASDVNDPALPLGKGGLQPRHLVWSGCSFERGPINWRDLALEVCPGKVTAIEGENASGKSTLMDATSRQIRGLSGVLEVNGATRSAGRTKLRPPVVSYCTQSAEEQILFVLGWSELNFPRKVENWREVCSPLIDLLAPDLHRCPWGLSFGQRKALIYATMLGASSVMFADEPFSSLDTQYRGALAESMRRYQEIGGAILATFSHSVGGSLLKADRRYILSKGAPSPLLRSE